MSVGGNRFMVLKETDGNGCEILDVRTMLGSLEAQLLIGVGLCGSVRRCIEGLDPMDRMDQ